MFRYTVKLNPRHGAREALSEFNKACREAGVRAPESVIEAVTSVATSLEKHGREMAGIGSTFKAERTVEGEDHTVQIVARFGPRRSLLDKLKALFGG